MILSCNNNSQTEFQVDEKEDETKNAQIAILGTLHFVSRNNTVSQEFTEIRDNKTQKELEILINKLKKFQPTKIAVERPYRSEKKLNQKYKEYLAGDYKLTSEETDQIAFRLGEKLGHKKLYLAYAPVNFDFESAIAFGNNNDQSQIVDSIINNAKDLANEFDQLARNKSLMDALYYINSEKAINKNHLGYLLTIQIGNKQNPVGAEIVGEWYKSNLRIYSNIAKIANSSSDRVLVLYGQGHVKILNQLINDSPNLDLIQINDFLK